MKGFIRFPGNPWPKGHGLKGLSLEVYLNDESENGPAHTALSLNLKSLDYCEPDSWETACEKADAQFENDPDISDWESMIVWNNYHACHIEAASTHPDLILTRDGEAFDPAMLDGFKRHIDPSNAIKEDDDAYFDARAFGCYILGHDAVAGHKIALTKDKQTGLYKVRWTGDVAQAYVGSYSFDQRFDVDARDVPFSGYNCYIPYDDPKAVSLDQREADFRKLAKKLVADADALRFVPGEYPYNDRMMPA